jgi:hypothetical protein
LAALWLETLAIEAAGASFLHVGLPFAPFVIQIKPVIMLPDAAVSSRCDT